MTRERLAAWPRPPARLLHWRAHSVPDADLAIDSLEEIQAGDSTQWIRVRGADASSPVLLLIQQGPGLPMINEARRFGHLLGLEQAFTVIYWD